MFSILLGLEIELTYVVQESRFWHAPWLVEEEQLESAKDCCTRKSTAGVDDEFNALEHTTISRQPYERGFVRVDEAATTDFYECSDTVVPVERRGWGLEIVLM